MIDRRILLASVASLFGLAAFRWLRATPAQRRREIRDRKDRRGMARAADAAAIRDPAQARHRAAGLEPAPQGEAQGHLRLRRLRPAAVLLGDQIRQRHRLAELLSAAAKRRRQDRGPHVRDDAHRSALPPLRRPSRPRLRRRAAADRPALLHERRLRWCFTRPAPSAS